MIFLVVALAISRVALANRLIESSQSLHDLDQKISELTTENESLSEQLRGKEALSLLSPLAQEAGFTKSTDLTFIQKSPSVALGTSNLSELLR